jgi:hypothetical protein
MYQGQAQGAPGMVSMNLTSYRFVDC